MLGLAAPVWLAALAALAVPLAIHLWSRRPSRVVRVATIRHLTGSPPASSRLRLNDPWLLLLRMLLIAAVVLVLAEPFLQRDEGRTPADWALVSPELLRDTAIGAPLADSLRRAGAIVRVLAPGVPEWSRPGPAGANETADSADARGGLWSSLREAAHEAPAGTRFVVFAEPYLSLDDGDRPRIEADVSWVVPPHAPSGSGHSPSGAGEGAENPPAAGAQPTVMIVAAADRETDARYVAAAFGAAGAGGRIAVLPADSAAAAAEQADAGAWLVWLGAAEPPEAFEAAARRGATLLVDGDDAGAGDAGAPAIRLVSGGSGPPAVLRFPAYSGSGGSAGTLALWSDATGYPLLSARRIGAGMRLDYAGRFDPASGGLVLHPLFPELIAGLIRAPHTAAAAAQPVSVAQILPARIAEESATPHARRPGSRRDLVPLLWSVAALLLVAERLLAARREVR